MSPEPFQRPNVWFFCKQGICLFWGGGNAVCYSTEMIKRGAKAAVKENIYYEVGIPFLF